MTGDQEEFAARLFSLAASPSSTPKAPSTQCGWHHYHHLWNHIQTSSHHMHQVLNKYRVILHQQISSKQKSTILHRDLGVHLPFFETAEHQIQFSWKLSLHPNIQVNPNTSPTQTIDAVFLRTILAPRKENNPHTHIYWNLPLFQATLLFLASSFKRCRVDPRFNHRRVRYVWDVNHPSIGNLRQAGFIHNLPSLKLT